MLVATHKMKKHMQYIILAVFVTLVGCATKPAKTESASTALLLQRRAELERRLREDELGVAWGVTRWISHAAEKQGVTHEIQEIDAELARRHVKPPQSAATPPEAPPTHP